MRPWLLRWWPLLTGRELDRAVISPPDSSMAPKMVPNVIENDKIPWPGLLSQIPRPEALWSGWGDLNSRPPRPERGTLTKLRYTP